MDIGALTVARAYAQARSATDKSAVESPPPSGNAAVALAESFVATLRNGEEMAKAAMTGAADPHSLVQALAASQLAVETAVTVRDRVVEAYQEILRMPV